MICAMLENLFEKAICLNARQIPRLVWLTFFEIRLNIEECSHSGYFKATKVCVKHG